MLELPPLFLLVIETIRSGEYIRPPPPGLAGSILNEVSGIFTTYMGRWCLLICKKFCSPKEFRFLKVPTVQSLMRNVMSQVSRGLKSEGTQVLLRKGRKGPPTLTASLLQPLVRRGC